MKTSVRAKQLFDKLETEMAIELVKSTFTRFLSEKLNLMKVSSPVAVMQGTGINDDLNGTERPVSFRIKEMDDSTAEIVHSLAKWKRLRLAEYEIQPGKGIITDMRALRPDEDFSPLHSIYVDQWDWEKSIQKSDRSLDYLKDTVLKIFESLKETEQKIADLYPSYLVGLPEQITFVHSEDLLEMYPDLTDKQREDEITKKYGAVFLIGIGGDLVDGKPHDGRAPDYDDWTTQTSDKYRGLNGDILVWHSVLKRSFEISSMGIRVDKPALLKQLKIRGEEDRQSLYFHKKLIGEELPESIGGGIGQSRLCMFMLRKQHIGEVQIGIWSDKVKKQCKKDGIHLM